MGFKWEVRKPSWWTRGKLSGTTRQNDLFYNHISNYHSQIYELNKKIVDLGKQKIELRKPELVLTIDKINQVADEGIQHGEIVLQLKDELDEQEKAATKLST